MAKAARSKASQLAGSSMLIEQWPVERPVDYPQNARNWTKKAIDKVRTSLRALRDEAAQIKGDKMIELGSTVKDVISGITGIVTGKVEYLTGCKQMLIQPRSKDGEYVEPRWFDEDRLELMSDATLRLPVKSQGFDKAAPKR